MPPKKQKLVPKATVVRKSAHPNQRGSILTTSPDQEKQNGHRKGIRESSERLIQCFQKFDLNGDGVIQRSELEQVMKSLAPGRWSSASIDKLMNQADTSGDGDIEYQEFITWLMAPSSRKRGSMEELRHASRGCFKSAQWVHVEEAKVSEFYKMDLLHLGEGGFASVSKAKNKNTGKARAIKTINKEVMDRSEVDEEIAIMKLLDHPNIAQVYEIYEDKDSLHLVMELCSGGELFECIIKNDTIKHSEVANVMRQILTGVQYMHLHGVCHRDLKPENFLLERELPLDKCRIKIIDFGVAAYFMEGSFYTCPVGTPDYWCPEMIDGKYNEACDEWACGVVMYILFSGELPFTAESDEELFAMILKGDINLTDDSWRDVSQDAKDLIGKLAAKKVENRSKASEAVLHPWLQETGLNNQSVALSKENIQNMRAFCGQNKLKKAAHHLIARRLSSDELSHLKKVFVSKDKDCDGVISEEELTEAIKEAGLTEFNEFIGTIVDEANVSWSDGINYTEFLAAALEKKHYHEERLCKAAFHVFDRDGNGTINTKELALVIHNSDSTAWQNSSEVKKILEECDTNKDGVINFAEFWKMMQSACE